MLGLSHSGVTGATMFPVLQDGQGAASLEDDDRAAIGAAYPSPTFQALLVSQEAIQSNLSLKYVDVLDDQDNRRWSHVLSGHRVPRLSGVENLADSSQ